jgi:hypothetical protein
MATLSLTDVQTIISNLVAEYTKVSRTGAHAYGTNGRTVQRHKLAELRSEIMEWSAVEQEMGGDTGNVALVTFGDPA